MEVFFIFLVVIVLTALAVGWLVVCAISLVLKLSCRLVALPFRIAGKADRAVAARFAARQGPCLPRRVQRGDDIQCSNRLCHARLPAEARFCAKCGAALARRRAKLPGVVVEVRSRGLSQVA